MDNKMKTTIFASKKKTKTGKDFYTYFTRLTTVDGEEETVNVGFNEETARKPKPDDCPLIIEFNREDANISTKQITLEDGRIFERKTLWIKAYDLSSEKYVDKSLDNYI